MVRGGGGCVTSIFSFSHNVFKRLLFQGHYKSGLCGRGGGGGCVTAFSPFPTMFSKGFFFRVIINRDCVVGGWGGCVTSIFSFSHNVFKRLLFQGHYKSGLCGKGGCATICESTLIRKNTVMRIYYLQHLIQAVVCPFSCPVHSGPD